MRYGTGMVLVVAAGVTWSLQGLIFRQIHDAGTWATLFWRSVGMIPVLLGFLMWRAGGSPLPAIRSVGLAGALGGLGLVGAFGGAIYSIQSTTIANAVFLFSASPFLTALIGWMALGERVRTETWAAMGVALAGIFIMVRSDLSGGALAGNAAALLSALGFAVFTVTLRWGKVSDSLPSVLLGGLFSIIAGATVAAQMGQTLAVPLPDALWAMAMGAVTLSGGMVLYELGSRVVPAAESALLSNIEVMLAPLWVWLFLGETASAATFLGGAVLLVAVTMNGISGARRAAAA
ncbi:DMT family transporter [Rhodobacteraceae bacterium HSP-20]|uniref:DMT family transporter n=1 Tax=Paragemmobacter amnigenus TaxID=2852097 RepID=A0ABS6J1V7_9RHOB|nr:DMT family transporter [Rhodobacter amnigenus]MBU9697555.1 DMT family transporter [Rhodobacter amnigenus]MBV4388782.1 DMT family transporter [Rhodobacter amnigenus]